MDDFCFHFYFCLHFLNTWWLVIRISLLEVLVLCFVLFFGLQSAISRTLRGMIDILQ